jgi:hypothetical protein
MNSFRVENRIFATVPDASHLRIMVDEMAIRAAVEDSPGCCATFYWGKRLSCVVVDLSGVTPELLEELLFDAWARKAPKRLLRLFDDQGSPDEAL